jgi:hypothetical protein
MPMELATINGAVTFDLDARFESHLPTAHYLSVGDADVHENQRLAFAPSTGKSSAYLASANPVGFWTTTLGPDLQV